MMARFTILALLTFLAHGVPAPASELAPVFGDVKSIFTAKCATCHRGPFLDLSAFPFQWDQSKLQDEIIEELFARMHSTGRGKMPPANGAPLTCHELMLLEAWRQGGSRP